MRPVAMTILGAVLVGAALPLLGPANNQAATAALEGAAPQPIAKATISSVVPKEVVDGAGLPIPVEVTPLPIDFFDDFSWRSFVALNWPAITGGNMRGEPDTAKKIGDGGARVWETWKTDYETFLKGGQKPLEWNSFDAVTPCEDIPFKDGGRVHVLGSFGKSGNLNQATDSGPGNPLVAQNRTYARYEVRFNRVEFNFLRDHELYLRDTLTNLKKPLRFDPNSIEVKAAWREIKDEEKAAAKGRYYLIEAKVPNPLDKNRGEAKTFALVGFHIVQKTALRPQWVWSTFEHVDNVPEGTPAAGQSYSFHNPAKPAQLDPAIQPAAVSAVNPPKKDPNPMQVVRLMPIHDNTVKTNTRYQEALKGTVWKNYQLVATQWPKKTLNPAHDPPDDIPGRPFFPQDPGITTSVANTVMETYFQDSVSCMGCHDLARAKKTDFVFIVHLRAFPSDDTVMKELGDTFRGLREKK